jgi:NDP-sugar pyrophosphorylase family protein
LNCLSEIDVVILAGGLGTRLRRVLPNTPKVMAPVDGKPFLRYVIDRLGRSGARRVVLSLGHLADDVVDYVDGQDWHGIEVVSHVEPEPMGTGGALREVLPLVGSGTVMAMNGDAFARAGLDSFVDFHRSSGATISILLTFVHDVGRYGVVEADDDGRVRSFDEKPQSGDGGGYVNAGVYLFQRTAIEGIATGRPVSLEREVFPRECGRGLYGFRGSFPFIDIGTPESYGSAGEFLTLAANDN